MVGVVVDFSFEKSLVLDSANDGVDTLRDQHLRQVFFAGCRLKFHYNWKTAGTKKKGKAIDLP